MDDPTYVESISRRLCPDISKLGHNWSIKNNYANQKDRHSFSIKILKCLNTATDQSCASDEKIEEVFKNMYFTIYLLKEDVNFSDESNYRGNPIIIKDEFFS
jgi:hypothetical protein